MQQNRQTNWGKQFPGNTTPEPQNKFFTREMQSNKTANMLDFEFKNGDHIAMPYAYLTKMTYNLSEGIKIEWGAFSIQVEGRNLKELYNYLVNHKVKSIKEVIDQDNIPEAALFIDKIAEI